MRPVSNRLAMGRVSRRKRSACESSANAFPLNCRTTLAASAESCLAEDRGRLQHDPGHTEPDRELRIHDYQRREDVYSRPQSALPQLLGLGPRGLGRTIGRSLAGQRHAVTDRNQRYSVEPAHLASYLNEFVFRFNRRRSRSRGMVFYRVLELAVAHDPVRYQDLIATRRPRAVRPTPPQVRGHPPSLERPPANRPWRTAALNWSG